MEQPLISRGDTHTPANIALLACHFPDVILMIVDVLILCKIDQRFILTALTYAVFYQANSRRLSELSLALRLH